MKTLRSWASRLLLGLMVLTLVGLASSPTLSGDSTSNAPRPKNPSSRIERVNTALEVTQRRLDRSHQRISDIDNVLKKALQMREHRRAISEKLEQK